MTSKSEHGVLSVEENGAECQSIQVHFAIFIVADQKSYKGALMLLTISISLPA